MHAAILPTPSSAERLDYLRARPALSPGEAAEFLGCSLSSVRRMIGRGELPAVRLGRLVRIPAAALVELLDTAGGDR